MREHPGKRGNRQRRLSESSGRKRGPQGRPSNLPFSSSTREKPALDVLSTSHLLCSTDGLLSGAAANRPRTPFTSTIAAEVMKIRDEGKEIRTDRDREELGTRKTRVPW